MYAKYRGKSTPHNLVVKPIEPDDIALQQRAKNLLKK